MNFTNPNINIQIQQENKNFSTKYVALWVPTLIIGIFSIFVFSGIYFYANYFVDKNAKMRIHAEQIKNNIENVVSSALKGTILRKDEFFLEATISSGLTQKKIEELASLDFNTNELSRLYAQFYKNIVMFVSFVAENRTEDANAALKKVDDIDNDINLELKQMVSKLNSQKEQLDFNFAIITVLSAIFIVSLAVFKGFYLIPKLVIRPMREYANLLEKNKEQYKIVADWTYDWEYWIGPNKEVIYMSPSVLRVTGYNVADFQRDPDLFEKIIFYDDLKRWKKHVSVSHIQYKTTGEAMREDIRIVHKNGQIKHIDHICRSVLGKNGEFLGIRVANRDVSEQREAQAKLKDLSESLVKTVELEVASKMELLKEREANQALLIQRSKMAETGEMIGVIAHQWKQPLNIIYLVAQNIEDSFENGELSEEELSGFIDTIGQQVKFMSKTIEDFRNFYKPSKEREQFVLAEAVEAILGIMRDLLKNSSIKIKTDFDNNVSICSYKSEFMQVILNILNNAKEAYESKKIDLQDRDIEMEIKKVENFAFLTIKDSAGGIDQSLLPEKIFENFITSKGESGTGVGLFLSKKIVMERMNGEISASNENNGAKFLIKIPISCGCVR